MNRNNSMDPLLARYLDGDLSESEAAEFLAALESDDVLEARLRDHERLASLAASMPPSPAPDGFTSAVMREVRSMADTSPRRNSRPAVFAGGQWLAAAAGLVLVFALGWQGARFVTSGGRAQTTVANAQAPRLGVLPASWVARSDRQDKTTEWMAVRFAYEASSSQVRSVTVAGSFNDWDPTEIPMHRENGVWTAVVVLPRENHEYMFVEDGQRWVADPNAVLTREDGFGGHNAVLDLRI